MSNRKFYILVSFCFLLSVWLGILTVWAVGQSNSVKDIHDTIMSATNEYRKSNQEWETTEKWQDDSTKADHAKRIKHLEEKSNPTNHGIFFQVERGWLDKIASMDIPGVLFVVFLTLASIIIRSLWKAYQEVVRELSPVLKDALRIIGQK